METKRTRKGFETLGQAARRLLAELDERKKKAPDGLDDRDELKAPGAAPVRQPAPGKARAGGRARDGQQNPGASDGDRVIRIVFGGRPTAVRGGAAVVPFAAPLVRRRV